MTAGLHPRALSIWIVASFVVVILVTSPMGHLVAICAAGVVALLSPDRRLFKRMLLIGTVVMLLRTFLFAIAGHEGATTLLTIPTIRLPSLVGGAVLGGEVKAEVVRAGIAEGLKLTALLACLGAFLSLTSPLELIRLIPRFLFEAALVLNIAIVFAPQLIASAKDISEAQRLRGSKRSARLRGLVIPLLTTALERSVELAESMDSRGFARREHASSPKGKTFVILGSLITCAAGALFLMGREPKLTLASTVIGAGFLIVGTRLLGRDSPRKLYRPRNWTLNDRLVAASASAAACAALWVAFANGPLGSATERSALFDLPTGAATAITASLAMPAALAGSKR